MGSCCCRDMKDSMSCGITKAPRKPTIVTAIKRDRMMDRGLLKDWNLVLSIPLKTFLSKKFMGILSINAIAPPIKKGEMTSSKRLNILDTLSM